MIKRLMLVTMFIASLFGQNGAAPSVQVLTQLQDDLVDLVGVDEAYHGYYKLGTGFTPGLSNRMQNAISLNIGYDAKVFEDTETRVQAWYPDKYVNANMLISLTYGANQVLSDVTVVWESSQRYLDQLIKDNVKAFGSYKVNEKGLKIWSVNSHQELMVGGFPKDNGNISIYKRLRVKQ